jgi:hypothetical protein
MTRINLFRATPVCNISLRSTPAKLDSIAWGKLNFGTTTSPLVFAAILIVCSLAVGCSSEKPKTESSINQPPVTQSPTIPVSTATAPVAAPTQAAAKPVHKRVVRKSPVTLTYTDKTSGLTFQYSRKYALKTGDAAGELISSDPVPMDFVQPGGVAVAAVVIPQGSYPKSDLASAFFNVSVNKALTAEQCAEFSEAKPNPATPVDAESHGSETSSKLPPSKFPSSKLMIGDVELRSNETLANVGAGKEASKYYHVFENGTCYELALKVATTGVEADEGGKPVDRDEVFERLEKILATVKIKPVAVPEVTASAPAAASAADPATPTQ